MLQFKPHLVLNRANEAFPAIHLYTLSMIICIQLHSKEENSKRVGVDLCQAGNFVYIATSGPFQGVQGQGDMGRMLINWRTLFSDICFKKSLLFCYLTHGTFSYPLHDMPPIKQVTNFNLAPIFYYCPLPLTHMVISGLHHHVPVHITYQKNLCIVKEKLTDRQSEISFSVNSNRLNTNG